MIIIIVNNMMMLMTKLTVMSRTTLEKAVRKPILILPARSTHHQTLQHCHHHPQYLQQHHDFDCNKKNDNNYDLDENDNNHNNQCEPVIPRKMMDRMNIAKGETSPAITPYHTYHFFISTSLTFITSKLPSQDDLHHLITFTTR